MTSVDDALNRLEEFIQFGNRPTRPVEALGAVRDHIAKQDAELQRRADEIDKAWEYGHKMMERATEAEEKLEAAEAELQRLRDETRTEREHRLLNETRRLTIERDAAEAEVHDALQQARDERREDQAFWLERCVVQVERAEAAETEMRRLTEGLRELISQIGHFTDGDGDLAELIDAEQAARALLADTPEGRA